jgi:putative transposase
MVMTATFRTRNVFVLMEVGSRRILHYSVFAHPTAEWPLQQVRETLPANHPFRFLLHDRDSIFSQELDRAVTRLGVRLLRTPLRAPKASSYCERLGGSLRRKCLDFPIPLSEGRLRRIVKEWGFHHNRGRPHSFSGPGIPEPSQVTITANDHQHKLPAEYRLTKTAVHGGWHHEYRLVKEAA